MKKISEIKITKTEKIHLNSQLFRRLDCITKGFSEGELITVAARPGRGKTSLLLQLATIFQYNYNVLFESIEMSEQDLVERAENFVDADSLTNLYISTESRLDKIEQDIIKSKAKVVFIDYLQIMSMKIKSVTWLLKQLAKKYKCVIFIASQLNRLADYKEPKLGMLRESGNIEQDSDQVWFLMEHSINILKNRRGPTDKIIVVFNKSRFMYYEDDQFYDRLNEINLQYEKAMASNDLESLKDIQNMYNNINKYINK